MIVAHRTSICAFRAARVARGSLALAMVLATVIAAQAQQPAAAERSAPSPVYVAGMSEQPDITYQNVSVNLENTYLAGDCNSGCCTPKQIQAANAAAAAVRPFHGTFWSINYDYLFNPCYTDCIYSDALKRRCLGRYGILDVGGSYSARFQREHNMRGAGLTGNDDEFLLNQTRVFANWELSDDIRIYAEYIDAVSFYEDYPPRPIEENRSDMLNLFGDFRLYEGCRGDLWFRIGRQELIYGEQRLVSPLPWGFTRRTFEGARMYWVGEDWNVDAFWTRPVIVNKTHFDSPDYSQEFGGIYTSYKKMPGGTLDIYYLRYLDNDAPTPFTFDTLGTRYKGRKNNFLWDIETAVQWGNYGANDHMAGMFTLGVGQEMPNLPGKPTAWVYYDWASGDETEGNGFHHLFPLAHKYLGFMDFYGRRNIEDLNMLVTASVNKDIKVLGWYHFMRLQDGDDVPYNTVMQPSAGAPGGSQYLGQELDLLLTWQFHPRMEIILGYSHFFAGSFYATNGTVPFDGDADFFYAWYTWTF